MTASDDDIFVFPPRSIAIGFRKRSADERADFTQAVRIRSVVRHVACSHRKFCPDGHAGRRFRRLEQRVNLHL